MTAFLTFEQLFYLYIGASAFFIIGAVSIFFIRRFKKRRELLYSLEFVLYEITLPRETDSKKEPPSFKELVARMEQFYVGMSAVIEKKWLTSSSFALEIALPSVGEEAAFYAAVPRSRARLFEKNLQSLYPSAKAEEKKEDYNIFHPVGGHAAAYLTLAENPVLPIRTYQRLDYDPLEIIANAFSKLKKEGEGATIQIILSHSPKKFKNILKSSIKAIREGKKIKSSKISLGESLTFLITGKSGDGTKKEGAIIDEETLKLVEEKVSFPNLWANIRLVASAQTQEEAEMIVRELSSSFRQFEEPRGNNFEIKPVSRRNLDDFIYKFSFRTFDKKRALILNTRELTSIYHFPTGAAVAPGLKFLRAKDAPAPAGLPSEGIALGENVYRGQSLEVKLSKDDRRRHLYIIGQTGTGKTTLLANMIKQDIESGEGVCVIDPHGDMVETILGYVPKNRHEDVIYFDPAETSRPMGFNFLEYDPAYPEQKTFIVNELLEIFLKLYADVPEALGPMFETYFRNSTLLVMEDPSSGNTLLEI